jgi:hypothetical protein
MHETLYVAHSICRTYMQTTTADTYAVQLLFRFGPVAQIDFTGVITSKAVYTAQFTASVGTSFKGIPSVY